MIRCSMCKRVPIENDLWVELETAIAERHLGRGRERLRSASQD